MSADNRPVATDALATLGTIIDETAARDAIHLAVEPAIAAVKLAPGQDVGFVAGGVGPCDYPVGIVDPFLKAAVMKGERFWLVVYPRQITSLRHVWSHPAFPPTPISAIAPVANKAEAEKWLREFADRWGMKYETMVHDAQFMGGITAVGRDIHSWGEIDRGDQEKFWFYLEAVTGERFSPSHRADTYFSCSC